MKKRWVALAVCLGTTALAGDAQTRDDRSGDGSRDLKTDTRKVGEDLGEATRTGLDKAGREARQLPGQFKRATRSAGRSLGWTSDDRDTFKAERAYSMTGTVKDAGSGRVTVVREGLPPAYLDVRDRTRATLNGQPVEVKDLPEGASVRAKFQVEGNDAVAVSLDATGAPRPREERR